MLPCLSVDQHGFADGQRQSVASLAFAQGWLMIKRTDRAHFVQGSVSHEDHTPSPVGQRVSALTSLSDVFGLWHLTHKDVGQKAAAEPVVSRRVGQTTISKRGTGRCPSVQSFSRLAQQSGSPLAAIRSPNNRLPVRPLVQAPQRSPAGRSFRVRRSVLRAMSPIASLTPANAAATDSRFNHSILTVPLALRAGGAVYLSFISGTAQPRLTRFFALPATVKGSADV